MADYCSVPTAPVESGEVFAGENELEQKVKAAGPLASYQDGPCFTVGVFQETAWASRGLDALAGET